MYKYLLDFILFYANIQEFIKVSLMKKVVIILSSLFFGITLGITRMLIIGNFGDAESGFFKSEYSYLGYVMMGIVLCFVIAYFIISRTTKDYPIAPRKGSKLIAIFSLYLGIICFVNFFGNFDRIASKVDRKQNLVIMVLLFVAAIYFILLAFSQLHVFRLSSKYAILPLFYFIAKLAVDFIHSFSLSRSQQIVAEIFCGVFLVIYFLVFSRYLAKSKFKKMRKHFYALSLINAVLLIAYGLSDLLTIAFYSDFAKARELNGLDSLLIFSIGIFVFMFLCASFMPKKIYSDYAYAGYDNTKTEINEQVEWDSLEEEK